MNLHLRIADNAVKDWYNWTDKACRTDIFVGKTTIDVCVIDLLSQ